MNTQDIRWIQSFNYYAKAQALLSRFIDKGELNELEKQGLIQAFEYVYELAWNLLKDYFEDQGETTIHSSYDTFLLAFRRGLIEDGETWMDMIKSKTLAIQSYDEETTEQIVGDIFNRYYAQFVRLQSIVIGLQTNDHRGLESAIMIQQTRVIDPC